MGAAADQLVKSAGGTFMQQALLTAAGLDAFHHLVSLLPQPVHVGNHLGRELQIAVQNDAAVPPGLPQPGENRRLLAEIAAEAQPPHLRVLPTLLADARVGLVPGTVVHEQNFIRNLRVVQNLRDGAGGQGDIVLLVVGRHDDGQQSHNKPSFPHCFAPYNGCIP